LRWKWTTEWKITVIWKPFARSRGQRTDKSWCKRLMRKWMFKEKSFEFRVKLMWGQGTWRWIISWITLLADTAFLRHCQIGSWAKNSDPTILQIADKWCTVLSLSPIRLIWGLLHYNWPRPVIILTSWLVGYLCSVVLYQQGDPRRNPCSRHSRLKTIRVIDCDFIDLPTHPNSAMSLHYATLSAKSLFPTHPLCSIAMRPAPDSQRDHSQLGEQCKVERCNRSRLMLAAHYVL